MTSTANDTQQNPPAEAPLTWTSSKVYGSQGLTHDATAEINGETWKFRVDSPSKGQWVARAWRDGDFALYREDRTMKGAKQQAQEHANYAATSTCTECRKIGGHKLDCGTGLAEAMAKDKARGTKLGLRAEVTEVQDSVVIQLRDEGAELLAATAELDETPDPEMTPGCARCKGSGIDPEHSYSATGPTEYSMGEPEHLEPCIDCQFPDFTGTLPDGTPVVADHKTMADQQRYVDTYGTNEIGPAVLKQLDPAEAQQLMAELEETFPHLAEWKRRTLGDRLTSVGEKLGRLAETIATDMTPAVVDAAESMRRMTEAVAMVQAARDRVQLRKDTCGCRTPLHTMRCGVGGRARVISSAVSA